MEKNDTFRILIIDDNPAIHQDFQKILKIDRHTSNISKLNKLFFWRRAG